MSDQFAGDPAHPETGLDQSEPQIANPLTGESQPEADFFRAARQRRVEQYHEAITQLDELPHRRDRLAAEIIAFDRLLGETTPLPETTSAPGAPTAPSRGRRRNPPVQPETGGSLNHRRKQSEQVDDSITAAANALRLEGGPLHFRDLYDKVAAQGVHVIGKDPAATLLARFSRDPRFQRVGAGTYALVDSLPPSAASATTSPQIPHGATSC